MRVTGDELELGKGQPAPGCGGCREAPRTESTVRQVVGVVPQPPGGHQGLDHGRSSVEAVSVIRLGDGEGA